jgi:hypothetical protein
MLKGIYYIAIIFALALGIAFAIRLIVTGVSACFDGSPIGLLYILAVYLVLYPIARFVLNKRFSKSSLIVLGVGTGNMCVGFIGLGMFYGIPVGITIAIEAITIVSAFIIIRRISRSIPLPWMRGEFPHYLMPDAISDDCAVYRSGRKGFQVLQFAEVKGSGTGVSVLLSAWKAKINLSFETYRLGDELCTFVSVWETSRDFDEAVKQAREKMKLLRDMLEKEGYDTRLIADELEIERYLYSPLLTSDGNRVEKLNKKYLEQLSVHELVLSTETKPILERVLSGEDFGEESAGYVLLLRPELNLDKEFRKAEKELKRKIEKLASNRFKKNDPASMIAMLSLTRDGSLIMQPGLEKKLTEARAKCQRMIDAKNCGLWEASLFFIGTGGDMTRIVRRVNTEKSGESVYNLIRRRRYTEEYNSEEVSELLPIQISMNTTQEQTKEEDAKFD